MDLTELFCMNIKGISLRKVKARGKDSCHNWKQLTWMYSQVDLRSGKEVEREGLEF